MTTLVSHAPWSGVRLGVEDDVPALVELVRHFLDGTPYGAIMPFDEPRVRVAVEHVVRTGGALVGVAGGVVVGMLGLIVYEHPLTGQKVAKELAWWVEPAYRGSSMAARLIVEAETWAGSKGCAVVEMAAPDAQVGQYYARRGFRAVETTWLKTV